MIWNAESLNFFDIGGKKTNSMLSGLHPGKFYSGELLVTAFKISLFEIWFVGDS